MVHLLESRLRDVRIDLGRREALVTEQLLDDAEVGATFEEVGGVRVAKCVGVDVAARNAVVEDSANVARSEAVTAPVVEECQRWRVVTNDFLACVRYPELHGLKTTTVQRDDPLFAALAEHAQESLAKVDTREIEPAQF